MKINFVNIFKNKKTRVILTLTLLASLLLAIKLAAVKSIPQIIKTDPADGQKEVGVEKTITITFDNEISLADWQIISFPEIVFRQEVQKNILSLTPLNLLKPQTTYTIEIHDSQKKSSSRFSFSTISPPPTEGRGDPDFAKIHQSNVDKYYPLLRDSPHQEENWSAGYSGPLTLVVSLKKDTPTIRQEVLDWISSKGVDPATHKITWKTQK